MIFILLLGAICVGSFLVLVYRAVIINSLGVPAIKRLEGYTTKIVEVGEEAPAERRITEVIIGIGRRVRERIRLKDEEALRLRILGAGLYSWTVQRYLGYRAVGVIGLPFITMLLLLPSGTKSTYILVALIVSTVLGWRLPKLYLDRRITKRAQQINLELPKLTDMLVVAVEAGVGLTSAIRLTSQSIRGPLHEEMLLLLQEQQMGLSTEQSLKNFASRCPTPSVRAFARSLAQSESLGVAMGRIMRDLADEMRKRRRAAAEERAQKAAVKMLFPLIFLIFPAMMIIMVGPAMFQMTQLFK